MKTRILLASAFTLLPFIALGQQAVKPDFEIARDAVARGEILPLSEVLQRLDKVHPGQVIEVELEDDDDERVYEIELITPDGRLIEVDVNAATGEILSYEIGENDDDDDDD